MEHELIIEAEEPARSFGRIGKFRDFVRKQFHAGRGGRAKLAISTSFVSRVITMAVSFVVVPITVRYLGNEGYGLMTTISAVVAWLQLANMGIGLGLQNALTEETAKGNAQAQRELVSTAVFSLLGIGAVMAIAGLIVFPQVQWQRVFPPTTSRFTAEIPWTVLVVFLAFVSTMVLGFVNPIYAARQELHVGNIQVLIISVLTLLGTFVAVHNRWGLFGVVTCSIGLTAVLQWLFAIWVLYGRRISEIRPQLSQVTRNAAHRLYKTGIEFFVMSLCNIAFFGIDSFLIARFLTVDQVTPYSVAQKIFLNTDGIIGVVTWSLWAAYGNAKAQGDYAWIRRTHGKMVKMFVLAYGVIGIAAILFGHWALGWWVGKAAAPGTILIVGVGLYFCARSWTALHAFLLNGLNVIRPQVWSLAATAILAVSLDLLLIKRLGPLGLAVGGFTAFCLSGAWYLPYLTSKVIHPDPTSRLPGA
jgi:O-antigen/teichoic acid export membrane protein